jgi:hypothetical protein
MGIDKTTNENVYAIVSAGLLIYAILIVFAAAVLTVSVREISPEESSFLWLSIASILSYPFMIAFMLFALVMVVKERLIRRKLITLVINLVVSAATMVYIFILPIVSIYSITSVISIK